MTFLTYGLRLGTGWRSGKAVVWVFTENEITLKLLPLSAVIVTLKLIKTVIPVIAFPTDKLRHNSSRVEKQLLMRGSSGWQVTNLAVRRAISPTSFSFELVTTRHRSIYSGEYFTFHAASYVGTSKNADFHNHGFCVSLTNERQSTSAQYWCMAIDPTHRAKGFPPHQSRDEPSHNGGGPGPGSLHTTHYPYSPDPPPDKSLEIALTQNRSSRENEFNNMYQVHSPRILITKAPTDEHQHCSKDLESDKLSFPLGPKNRSHADARFATSAPETAVEGAHELRTMTEQRNVPRGPTFIIERRLPQPYLTQVSETKHSAVEYLHLIPASHTPWAGKEKITNPVSKQTLFKLANPISKFQPETAGSTAVQSPNSPSNNLRGGFTQAKCFIGRPQTPLATTNPIKYPGQRSDSVTNDDILDFLQCSENPSASKSSLSATQIQVSQQFTPQETFTSAKSAELNYSPYAQVLPEVSQTILPRASSRPHWTALSQYVDTENKQFSARRSDDDAASRSDPIAYSQGATQKLCTTEVPVTSYSLPLQRTNQLHNDHEIPIFSTPKNKTDLNLYRNPSITNFPRYSPSSNRFNPSTSLVVENPVERFPLSPSVRKSTLRENRQYASQARAAINIPHVRATQTWYSPQLLPRRPVAVIKKFEENIAVPETPYAKNAMFQYPRFTPPPLYVHPAFNDTAAKPTYTPLHPPSPADAAAPRPFVMTRNTRYAVPSKGESKIKQNICTNDVTPLLRSPQQIQLQTFPHTTPPFFPPRNAKMETVPPFQPNFYSKQSPQLKTTPAQHPTYKAFSAPQRRILWRDVQHDAQLTHYSKQPHYPLRHAQRTSTQESPASHFQDYRSQPPGRVTALTYDTTPVVGWRHASTHQTRMPVQQTFRPRAERLSPVLLPSTVKNAPQQQPIVERPSVLRQNALCVTAVKQKRSK